MAGLKTQVNEDSAETFLNSVKDEKKRADCFEVLKLMQKVTEEPPKMWGSSIVGFGSYPYTYASGREGEWMLTAFSPRKQNLTLYIMDGFEGYEELLQRLGDYKTGKSCLYIKRLEDVDRAVLEQLITASVAHMKNRERI